MKGSCAGTGSGTRRMGKKVYKMVKKVYASHIPFLYYEIAQIVIKNNDSYIENMTKLSYNIGKHEKCFLKGE